MKPPTEYIKPALGTLAFVSLVGGYYWWEHRPHREKPETTGQALVVVAKTVNACFSDMVRVTGFIVPKREAVVGADQEGSKVTDLFVREGDIVTENQELARLSAPPQQPGGEAAGGPARAGPAPGARRGSGHRGPHHRRCAGFAPGRPDVPHCRQQRDRARCRGAERPHPETQSRCDRPYQPRRRA